MASLEWLRKLLASNRSVKYLSVSDHDGLGSNLINGNFTKDLLQLKTIFNQFSDVVYREFKIGGIQRGVFLSLDGLVDMKFIDSDVIKPLIDYGNNLSQQSRLPLKEMEYLVQDQVLYAPQINIGESVQDVLDHVLSGYTALLVDGVKQVLFISAKEWDKRAVDLRNNFQSHINMLHLIRCHHHSENKYRDRHRQDQKTHVFDVHLWVPLFIVLPALLLIVTGIRKIVTPPSEGITLKRR